MKRFSILFFILLWAFAATLGVSCSDDDDDSQQVDDDDDDIVDDDDDDDMTDECPLTSNDCGENEVLDDPESPDCACVALECPIDNCPDLMVLDDPDSVDCACVSEIDDNPDCDPLVPESCAMPWPSDFFTAPDPSRATGLALDYGPTSLPANTLGDHVNNSLMGRMDGHPVMPQILAHFPGGVDRDLLPGRLDLSESLDPDSTTVLIDMETGRWIPHYSDTDGRTDDPTDQAIFIRPMETLAPGGRYAAAFRNLRDANGDLIEASPAFRAYRDDIDTGMEIIEDRRAAMEDVLDALEDAGVDRDSLQLAWDFTIRSDRAATSDLLTLSDLAYAAVDAEGSYQFEVTETVANPKPVTDTRIHGKVRMPLFLDNANAGLPPYAPGASLTRDAYGEPMQNGWTEEVPFLVNIPPSVANGEKVARFFVYGHGLLGDRGEANGTYLNCLADKYGLVIIATDWWGMNEDDEAYVGATVLPDFTNFIHLTERTHQGILNTSLMSDFILMTFAESDAFAGSNGKIDNWEPTVYYYGNSQGGIFGPPAVSIDRHVDRAVFGVPGMNYTSLIPHSTDFVALDLVMSIFYDTQFDWELVMSISQSAWDTVDPVSYIPYVSGDPFPGRPQKRGLWQIGAGDAQVDPITMDVAGRSWGIPQLAPVIESVFGVDEVEGPYEGSTLVYYDPELETRPLRNIFPDEDYGTHEWVRRTTYAQEQMNEFFKDGTVSNHCGGPCSLPPKDEQCK